VINLPERESPRGNGDSAKGSERDRSDAVKSTRSTRRPFPANSIRYFAGWPEGLSVAVGMPWPGSAA